jgi:hypothetical protein
VTEPVRHKVNSSDVATIAYDPAAQTLSVEFHATGWYRYFSVPADVVEAFVRTPSPGKFFRQHIKGKYAWEKADGAP